MKIHISSELADCAENCAKTEFGFYNNFLKMFITMEDF